MIILTLKRIVLLDRPDDQTRTFYSRVQSWMSQWTVENNYRQIIIENEDDEQDALAVWADKFEDTFKNAISEVYPKDGSMRENFELVYYSEDVTFGKEIGSAWATFAQAMANVKVAKDLKKVE